MNNCGLTSITFRELSALEIINRMKDTGLRFIEWGSDVHVPEGDFENAKYVRKITEQAGISISSYGTYYKLGNNQDIMMYIETAKILKAPILRIWAGTEGSEQTDEITRKKWTTEAKQCCIAAAKYGLKVAFEYHPNTLTDEADSALRLVKEIDEPNCRLYWQPNYQKTTEENIDALNKVLPYVDIIHVFFWEPDFSRRFLKEGKEQLCTYLSKADELIKLLEFVPDDNINYLKQEADSLFEIIKDGEE